MKKNVVRAFVLGAIATATLAFAACGGSKKKETITVKQKSPAETKAGKTTKAGEPRTDETTKADETKTSTSKRDDKAVDVRESTMVGTLDKVEDFAFTLADEKGMIYQFTFEQGRAPEGLSDVKADDKVAIIYTGTISETDLFEGIVVSIKKA